MKKIVFIIIFSLLPFFIEHALSQPPPPPPQEIPLDGGLSALIIAGLAYGARKLYLQQKENDSIE
jgi:hypothetical protein